MCGILGFVAPRAEIDLSAVTLESLRNRGPDNIGRRVEGRVGLYHTRLAVIDAREASNQPLVSADGDLSLVCNGEIYNHAEIRAACPDYPFQSGSDCEAVLAVYRRDGAQGFRKLRGMYSFALYDKKKKTLYVHRDPVGKKPLFYHHSRGLFAFSSDVTALNINLGKKFSIDPDALRSYWDEGFVDPQISFYREIRPVMPGQCFEVRVDSAEMSVSRIEPEPETASFEWNSREILREAEKRLDESVRRRLEGIRRPVLLFSGGIDSTVLAKKMSALAGDRLVCLSIRPLIPGMYDDLYARYAARKMKIKHVTTPMGVGNLRGTLDRAISVLDQPLSLFAYYFMVTLTLRAREFGNVLYTGEGGDEVFYGYDNMRHWFGGRGFDAPAYRVGPPLPEKLSEWGARQLSHNLLGHSLVKVDKATAEQRMEARCPYLDWDLMAFMRRVPTDYWLAQTKTKVILKNMLPEFPGWFKDRPKVGSAFNFRYLMIPRYREIFERIDFGKLKRLGLPASSLGFSRRHIFSDFGYFWKMYVLTVFLEKEGM